MKKRIFTLLLAALMVLPMLLTSCSDDGANATVFVERPNLRLTMYAITDEKTTDEAIAEVEEEVGRLTYLRYKTYLDLRFFTKDEYQAALDASQAEYDKIAEESVKVSESVEASRKKEKEIEKSMTPEELRRKRQEDRLKAKESVRASKQAEQERLDRIEAGIELPPEPVTKHQMDIVFIESFDKLVEMADAESLVALDKYLDTNFTILSDYIQPAVMAGVTNAGNGKTYAIPTNSIVTPEGSFMLFKKDLVDKYKIDLSKVVTLADASAALATIKANEPGLLPVEKPVTTIAEFDFYLGINGGPIGVMNTETEWLNKSGQADILNAAPLKNHFTLMYNWRVAGYFTTGPAFTEESSQEEIDTVQPEDATADFFMTVREGSYYDIEKWEEEGYYVVTHKSPEYNTENSLKTFYGISVNCEYPDRAMEILKMMTTDSQVKNLLQYGIEDVNYSVNDDKKTITMLNDDYVMDFYGTGNTFIGYIPEEMGADYLDKALEMSKHARINGFIGFDPHFTEEELAMYNEMTEAAAEVFNRLCNGTTRVTPIMKEATNAVEAVATANETTYKAFIDKFNETYKSALKVLNEKSRLIRPTTDNSFDFISDEEAAKASSTTVAGSAPATTVAAVPPATTTAAPASSSKK